MENQIVVFQLGAEYYGVNINRVESIIKMQVVTRVPHTPAWIEGITNLRGRVLPVMDLRRRFGLPAVEREARSRIMVVRSAGAEVGMMVDAVSEVMTLADAAIEAVPPLSAPVDSDCVTGIAKVGPRLVILLDLDQVLGGLPVAAPQQMAAL